MLRSCREAIVADRFHPCLWVRPWEGWIVSAHPDALVVVPTIRRVLDVVADIERVVDSEVQLFVEMSAVVHAAADPGNAERARSRAPRRHICIQCHRCAVQDVGPPREEIGERAFLELFNENDIRVVLDSRVSGVKSCKTC